MRHKGLTNTDLLLNHPQFHDVAIGIQELQELANRNRATSFSNQLKNERIQLETYLAEFGTQVTDHDYSDSKVFESPTVKSNATDLMKARHLYFKFKIANLKDSLHTKYQDLSERVNALNFDTSDNVCLSAQSFNNSYRRFIKYFLINLAAKKTLPLIAPGFDAPYALASALGERQIIEMSELLNRAQGLLNGGLNLENSDDYETVSTIAFELITCLHYAKKILQNQVPGSFINAFFHQILDKNYFSKLFKVAARLTMLFESHLNKGSEINLFSGQSVRILWREINMLLEQVVQMTFIPQEKDLQKFIFDYMSHMVIKADG
mmetsp:Transcript_20545/g.31272  ORF Transcript_20545/g.31272 Transcript_20545/m.31272 type:complete len:321 (-) Transcript_20545:1844-2806(-)